ncbi:Helix-turn-helix domain-containing protein [Micromonospora chokoriensis]|uniref:Helix-turn-helix domain-containing protein n=2 Tax=Micromonospora chokoriensis TaxID=356851 RepID=A0A1C4WY05_9ACTN|nr:Helix-turn-helix domain-containing protein [Micromonospora chokoriensis]
MDTFGQLLRRHRESAGLSLRQLDSLIHFQYSHISQVERGDRRPTEALASACDRALGAEGALIEAYRSERAGATDMRRRTMLRAVTAMAAGPAVAPLAELEALRHGLGGAATPHHDEWEQITADYGHGYYRQARPELMAQLSADLTVLQHQIAADTGTHRARLLRAAARLSVIVALSLVASGQIMLGRRWWQTAHRVHQAARLIRGGLIPDGLRCAADTLDALPVHLHNHVLRSVAGQVTDAVPRAEWSRPAFADLADRVRAQSYPPCR